MDDIVQLYTTNKPEDSNPAAFPYYLDYDGAQCLQVACTNLHIYTDPMYALYWRSNTSSGWLDVNLTLRTQGVQNGDMIHVLPDPNHSLASTGNLRTMDSFGMFCSSFLSIPDLTGASSIASQGPTTPMVYEAINVDEVEPTEMEEFDPDDPIMPDGSSDEDTDDEDLIIDTSVTDFATNAFGALQFSTFTANDGLVQVKQLEKKGEKPIELVTSFGFDTKHPKSFPYFVSMSYEELVNQCLMNLEENKEGRYCLLLEFTPNDRRWINPGNYLEDFNPVNGLILYIFKSEMPIRIYSDHFPAKMITLDISLRVGDLLPEIGKAFDLESYMAFTLWHLDNKDYKTPMTHELSIPQQCSKTKELYFKRRFFTFSREDLYTLKSTEIAFKDAYEEFLQNEIRINDQLLLKVLMLRYVASLNKGDIIDYSKIPDDQTPFLPENLKHLGKKLGAKVRSFAKSHSKVDKFNSSRKLLGILRRLPGFASTNFANSHVDVKFEGKKESIKIIVQVAPHCLRFINPTNNCLEERISYSKIVSMKNLGTKMEIQFAAEQGKISKYKIRNSETEKIKLLIQQYREIVRCIQEKRAKERAAKFGGDADTFVDEATKISLFCTTDLKDNNPKKFFFDIKFKGKTVVQAAEQYLELQRNPNHIVLIKQMENSYRWLMDDQILELMNIQTGMTIYLLENFKEIKIQFCDGQTSKISLDITKTIEDLTPAIFQKWKIPHIYGYTLWDILDYEDPKPLDTRYSIPEQCKSFSTLLFKRRFYVISGEVLQNPLAAHITLCDCRDFILAGNCQVSEDETLELAYYALYATLDNQNNVDQIKHIDLASMVPKNVKVTKKLEKKFIDDYLMKRDKIDKFPAAKQYLGKARRLPGFGEEKFKCIYRDASFGANVKIIRDCLFSVGPLKVILIGPDGKVLNMIPYRLIVSFESMGKRLVLKYISPQTRKISISELKVMDIDTCLMLMNYNIKIIRDLMLAKQRKAEQDREDDLRRLHGGYTDDNGVVHGPMIDYLISKSLSKQDGLPKMWLESSLTGKEVAKIVPPLIKLDVSIEYSILMKLLNKYFSWVLPEETLGEKNPQRNTILFILNAHPSITVELPDGTIAQVEIQINNIVVDVIEEICTKLELPIIKSVGYTLYVPNPVDKNEPIPLDISTSIPEQTDKYDYLILKRRFFVFTEHDYENNDVLHQTFYDVNQHVVSGKIPVKKRSAVILMHAYLNGPDAPKPYSTPREVEPYLPKDSKYNEKEVRKRLKKVEIKTYADEEEAMNTYINTAIKIPQFGCEMFNVLMLNEDKKGKLERTKGNCYIGPRGITILDLEDKEELFFLPYNQYVSVERVNEYISVKYRKVNEMNYPHFYLDLESLEAEQIEKLILGHLYVKNRVIKMRIEEEGATQPSDTIELVTIYNFDHKKAQRFPYDVRMNGNQVIESAIKCLDLDPEGQYSCLLTLCDDTFVWVPGNATLGLFNPEHGLTIHIYNMYMPITITSMPSNLSRLMLLKIERPICELLEEIAFKTYTDFYLGYTLYKREKDGTLKPLDLRKSIPEQIQEFSNLIFKRRFLIFTKDDLFSPITSQQLYPDVQENILSGVPKVKGSHVLELAVYSIFIECKTVDKVLWYDVDRNIEKLVPNGFKIKPKHVQKVKNGLKSNLTPQSACPKYISTARNCVDFGCELFYGFIREEKGEFEKKKTEKIRPITISIGPFGLQIIEISTNKDLMKTNHQSIVRFDIIKDRVDISVTDEVGSIHTLPIISNSSYQIVELLFAYKFIIIPMLNERSTIQVKGRTSEIIDLTTGDYAQDLIKLYPTIQLDHPRPEIQPFSKNLQLNDVFKLGTYYLTIPNKEPHVLMVCNEENFINPKYMWLQTTQKLGDLTIYDNAHIYIIKETPICQVINAKNFVRELPILIKDTIIKHVEIICSDYRMGHYYGYTFYEWLGFEQPRPLDFLYNVPMSTTRYTELVIKRRFLMYTRELLEDGPTLYSAFNDSRNCVMHGLMELTEEDVVELVIISFYATTPNKSDVMTKLTNVNEESFRKLLPDSQSATPQLFKKFNAMTTSIPPLEQKEAQFQYITKCYGIKGYGEEQYQIRFTCLSNMTFSGEIDCIVLMNPFFFTFDFEGKENEEDYANIDWHSIIDYQRSLEDNTAMTIKYQNATGAFFEIRIRSENDIREVFSFVNDICELLKLPQFENFPDLIQEEKVEEVNLKDIKFEEFTVDEEEEEIEFMERNINLRLPTEDEENYIPWRITHEGLMIHRTILFAKTLSEEIDELHEFHERGIRPKDLYTQLNLINDQLKLLIKEDELDHATHNQLIILQSALDELRDTTYKVANTKLTAESKEKIQQLVKAVEEKIKPLIDAAENNIDELKTRLKELADLEGITPEARDIELTRHLIQISELQEELAQEFHQSGVTLEPISYNLIHINTLQAESAGFTSLADLVYRANADLEQIRKHMDPLIAESQKELGSVHIVIDKANEGQIDVPKVIELHQKLVDILGEIYQIHYVNQCIVKPMKKRFTVCHGRFNEIIPLIQALNELQEDYQEVKKHKSFPSEDRKEAKVIHSEFDDIIKQFTSDIAILAKDNENEQARVNFLVGLDRTEEYLKALIRASGDKDDKKIAAYTKQIDKCLALVHKEQLQLSTINITSINCKRILEDIEAIIKEYEMIDKEELEKKYTQEQIDQAIKVIEDLKKHKEQMTVHIEHLSINPVSGKYVSNMQNYLLQIQSELPSVKELVENMMKITDGILTPVVYERLTTNVTNTLIEKPPTEEIENAKHLISFRSLQTDTAHTINQLFISMETKIVHQDEEFHERMKNQIHRLNQIYLDMINHRKIIHAHPFNQEVLYDVLDEINTLYDQTLRIQSIATHVTTLLSSHDLENSNNVLMKNAKKTNSIISSAMLGQYNEPPTEEEVIRVDEIMKRNIEVLAYIQDDFTDIEPEIRDLRALIPLQTELGFLRTPDYFALLRNIQQHLISLEEKVVNCSLYSEYPQYQESLNEFLHETIDVMLGGSIPNTDSVIRCLTNVYTNFEPLKAQIEEIANNPGIKNDKHKLKKEIKKILKGIDKMINSIYENLEHPDDITLNIDQLKNDILRLMKKLTEIPTTIKRVMSLLEVEDAARTIGVFNDVASYAVCCIRQLPSIQKLSIDPTPYVKYSRMTELDELIPGVGVQIQTLINFLEPIPSSTDLNDYPHTIVLISKMKEKLDFFSPDDFQAKETYNEDKINPIIQEAKETMPFIVHGSDLIAPIIEDTELVDCINILQENLRLLFKQLSEPHMTHEDYLRLKELLIPVLTEVEETTRTEFKNREDVRNNMAVSQATESFLQVAQKSLNALEDAKPFSTQAICDNIYMTLLNNLPIIMENPEHDSETDDLFKIFEIVYANTSLPKRRIRYTHPIMIRTYQDSDNNLNVIEEALKFLISDVTKCPKEVVNGLEEMLNQIIKSSDSYPVHHVNGAQNVLPFIQGGQKDAVSKAVLTLASCVASPEKRVSYLEKLFVNTSIQTATYLKPIKNIVDQIQEMYSSHPEMFDQETTFYLAQVINSMEKCDTNLLLNTPSVVTSLNEYQPMRELERNIHLLLPKIKDTDTLSSTTSRMESTLNDYSNWIFETDMAYSALFQSHVDTIAINTEEIMLAEKENTPPELKQHVRKITVPLRTFNRDIFYQTPNDVLLAQMYQDYVQSIKPIIDQTNESENRKNITASINRIEKLTPMIKYFDNPTEGFNTTKLCQNVYCLAAAALAQAERDLQLIQSSNEADQKPYNIAEVNARISFLNYIIHKSTEDGYGIDEFVGIIEDLDMNVTNFINHPHDQANCETATINIIEDLKKLMIIAQNNIKLDYDEMPEEIDFQERNVNLIQTIDDLSLKEQAKAVAAFTETVTTKPSRVIPPKRRNRVNAVSITVTDFNDNDSNFNEGLTILNLVDPMVLPLYSTKQEELKEYADSLKNNTQNISLLPVHLSALDATQRTDFAQGLQALQQQQIAEFPNVTQVEIKHQYTPNEIQAATKAIVEQSLQLNHPHEIHKLLKSCTIDQIALQQRIIQCTIKSIVDNEKMTDTAKYTPLAIESQNTLFETVYSTIKESKAPILSPIDLDQVVDRQFSILSVFESLLALKQLLVSCNPQIFKFVQSDEGQELMKAPMTAQQIFENQNIVFGQIPMLKTPDILNANHASLLPEQIILQIRIINNLLDIIASPYGKNLRTKRYVEGTTQSVMQALIDEQNSKIRNNAKVLRINSIVDSKKTLHQQQEFFDRLVEAELIDSLMNLQKRHVSIHQSVDVNNTKISEDANNDNKISLLMQLDDAVDVDSVIKKLNKDISHEQQMVLLKIISILVNPAEYTKLTLQDPVSIDVNEAFQHNVKFSLEQLSNTMKKIINESDIEESEIVPAYNITDISLLALSNEHVARLLMHKLELLSPTIRSKVSMTCDMQPEQVQRAQTYIINFINMNNHSPTKLDDALKNLDEEDRQIVYNLLTIEGIKLHEISQSNEIIKNIETQSRIFDVASLIQVQQNRIKSIPKAKEIPTDAQDPSSTLVAACKRSARRYVKCIIHTYPDMDKIDDTPAGRIELSESLDNNTLAQLPENLVAQLRLEGDEEEMRRIYKKQTTNILHINQLMVAQMLKDLNNPEIVNPILKNMNVPIGKETDPNYVNELMLNLLKKQQLKITQDRSVLLDADTIDPNVAPRDVSLSEEDVQRHLLFNKLAVLQAELEEIAKDEKIDVDTMARDIILQTGDVLAAQNDIKTLAAIDASKLDIQVKNKGKTAKQKAIQILVLRDMINKVRTADIETSNDEEVFDTILYRNVSFEIPDTTGETQELTDGEISSKIGKMSSNLISFIPMMAEIPEEENMELFRKLNKKMTKILVKLFNSPDTCDSQNVDELCSTVPQHAAALSSALKSFNEETKRLVVKQPVTILSHACEILKASNEFSSEKERVKYRSNIHKLLILCRELDGAINNDVSTDPLRYEINLYSSIVENISKKDVIDTNMKIIDIHAARVRKVSFSILNKYSEEILTKNKDIEELFSDLYARGISLPDDSEQINKYVERMIAIISAEAYDPFEVTDSLTNLNKVSDLLEHAKKLIKKSALSLTRSIQEKDRSKIGKHVCRVITNIGDAHAAVVKGFLLKNKCFSNIFLDFLASFDNSIHSLNQIVYLLNNSIVSSTHIRRSIRPLVHKINSMLDVVEDEFEYPEIQSNDTEKMKQIKRDYTEQVAKLTRVVANILSLRASTGIHQVYKAIIAKHNKLIEDSFEGFSLVVPQILSANTDAVAANEFKEPITQLLLSTDLYYKSFIKNDSLLPYNDSSSQYMKYNHLISVATTLAMKLTDASPLSPDIENAEKLPKRFVIPDAPLDTLGKKIYTVAAELPVIIEEYDEQREKFEKLMEKGDKTNSEIVVEFNKLHDKMNESILQILRCSSKIMFIDIQEELAKRVVDIVFAFDDLIRKLRAKFLLITEPWNEAPGLISRITELTQESVKLTADAARRAAAGEEELAMRIARIKNTYDPLQRVLAKLTTTKERAFDATVAQNKQWALKLTSIGLSLIAAESQFIVKSIRPAPMEFDKIYDFLDQVDLITLELDKWHTVGSRLVENTDEDPEGSIINTCNSFETQSHEINDEILLKNLVSQTLKELEKLKESAEAARIGKDVQKARKEAAAKGELPTTEPRRKENAISAGYDGKKYSRLPSDKIQERLEIETKVLKARIILSHSEKKLQLLDLELDN